jgi:hypothetical protein
MFLKEPSFKLSFVDVISKYVGAVLWATVKTTELWWLQKRNSARPGPPYDGSFRPKLTFHTDHWEAGKIILWSYPHKSGLSVWTLWCWNPH